MDLLMVKTKRGIVYIRSEKVDFIGNIVESEIDGVYLFLIVNGRNINLFFDDKAMAESAKDSIVLEAL